MRTIIGLRMKLGITICLCFFAGRELSRSCIAVVARDARAESALIDAPLMPSVVYAARSTESFSKTSKATDAANEDIILSSTGRGDLFIGIGRQIPPGTSSSSSAAAAAGVGSDRSAPAIESESSAGADFHVSPPCYPLRPAPPLQGVRAFQLVAAMQDPLENDVIIAIIWAIGKGGRGGTKSICEIFLLRLDVGKGMNESIGGQVGEQSQSMWVPDVQDVQLLARSQIPPHGALCNTRMGSILLVIDPLEENNDALGRNRRPIEEIEDVRVGKSEEDGEEAVSPRTLQAAASRLAHMTSEEDQEETSLDQLPRDQYADIFRETGPDGVGSMGSEPGCVLLGFQRKSRQGQGGELGGGESKQSSSAEYACTEKLLCAPHRFLGCQGTSEGGLRLGLTDDVDCVVIEIRPVVADTRGEVAKDDNAASSAALEQAMEEQSWSITNLQKTAFRVEHVGSLPALGYIAAGKLHRKYLVMANIQEASTVSAALIESRRYMYVYGSVDKNATTGDQQVVDVGFERGNGDGSDEQRILGAVLLPSGFETNNMEQNSADPGRNRIVLLSDERILLFEA